MADKKKISETEADIVADPGPSDGFTELEKASGALGSDEVQEKTDEAEAKGYIGVKADPRPNSDYSMEGGAPGATES